MQFAQPNNRYANELKELNKVGWFQQHVFSFMLKILFCLVFDF